MMADKPNTKLKYAGTVTSALSPLRKYMAMITLK